MSLLELQTHSPEETRAIGIKLGQMLQSGDVICLSGELGAGKTTLAAGIGQGWGVQQPLTSPTFVIVHQHDRSTDQQHLHHVDAYRIQNDADSIGLEDLLASAGVVVIEWAEHLRDYLPEDYLWITLDYDEPDNARFLTFIPHGKRSLLLMTALQEEV